jgi:hypothetical protein
MKSFGGFYRGLRVVVKQNGPLISSAVAGVGVGVTAYLAARASFQATHILDDLDEETAVEYNRDPSTKEKAQAVWKLYIPAAAAGGSTLLCIFAGHRLATHKALAAQAALAVTERAYSEYREKLIEEFGPEKRHLGEAKDRAIREQIAQDHVRDNPPPKVAELQAGIPGDVLCHEAFTGRYFMSSKQKLEDARNKLNAKALKFDYATMDDFYHDIGLRFTSTSGENGWRSGRMMELLYSTVETEDGRPALSFEYNYVDPIGLKF